MKSRENYFVFMALLITACTVGSCTTKVSDISISPLEEAVIVDEAVSFKTSEAVSESLQIFWDFGDGKGLTGPGVEHVYEKPGFYHVTLYQEINGDRIRQSSAIVRVHTPGTVGLPQVLLDTDARNEIDDQHFIAYALYSGIDVLGINSIHNKQDLSEPKNYGEICHVLQLMWDSDFQKQTPLLFHGAKEQLKRPESGVWSDTEPVETEASNAILAAARGASPENPVFILPVGPCTNIASALLQAHNEGFDLKERIRVIWLGGGPESAGEGTYNGRNDPWSVFVVGESGIDLTVMLEHPTSARLNFDKRIDSDRYPDTSIGYYLRTIIMARLDRWDNDQKSLYDLTTVSTVINNHLGLEWLTEVEDMRLNDEDGKYVWTPVEESSNVHVIWDINEEAMKEDFFNTLSGNPTNLVK